MGPSPDASLFHVSRLHVVIHAQTFESRNHDLSDQVPRIIAESDSPDEYRHFRTSAFWESKYQDSGNLCTPYFSFPEMTFSVVWIWCHASYWIGWLLLISSFGDSDILQATSTTFSTPDSCADKLSLISEL
jgi:hypothetical protein